MGGLKHTKVEAAFQKASLCWLPSGDPCTSSYMKKQPTTKNTVCQTTNNNQQQTTNNKKTRLAYSQKSRSWDQPPFLKFFFGLVQVEGEKKGEKYIITSNVITDFHVFIMFPPKRHQLFANPSVYHILKRHVPPVFPWWKFHLPLAWLQHPTQKPPRRWALGHHERLVGSVGILIPSLKLT